MATPRTRPFVLTMQVQRLESSRVWLLLLALSVVLAVAWVGWAFGDSVPVYAQSEQIDARHDAAAEATHIETRGNITQVGLRRVRELDVRFPGSVGAQQLADRSARVELRGDAGVITVAGVITAVEVVEGELVARVRVELDGGVDDPFEHAEPERVRVEIGSSAPVELWFPELARLGWPYRERAP
jgi:hypothetical protein